MNIGPEIETNSPEDFNCLHASGALPPFAELSTYLNTESPEQGLQAVWKEWLRQAPKSRRSRAARIHSGLTAAINSGAKLTFSLPNHDHDICRQWLGQRAFWWPDGTKDFTGVGVVSSRLPRNNTTRAVIFQTLSQTVSAVSPASERLVASSGTSLCDHIEQCANLFNLPLLRISSPADKQTPKPWIEELIRPPEKGTAADLIISPQLAPPASDSCVTTDSPALPEYLPTRDRVLALLSHRVFVLNIRRGGNWWHLLKAGIEKRLWKPGAVRVVSGTELCSEEVINELQSLGAVRWQFTNHNADTLNENSHSQFATAIPHETPARDSVASETVAEETLIKELAHPQSSTEWLTHWTRAPQSEWAGETRDEYLKSVVLNDSHSERTAYATLKRIIQEQTIRATPHNTRVAVSVVCLADIPLTTLATQRIFRPHRGRWDFEQYGICVRKQQVHSIGGRPVIYGDEATWKSMPEGERAWFQLKYSQAQTTSINWTVENEWRLTRDLHLGHLPATDVFAFCSTEEEAIRLRPACPWRVLSIERLMTTMSSDQ